MRTLSEETLALEIGPDGADPLFSNGVELFHKSGPLVIELAELNLKNGSPLFFPRSHLRFDQVPEAAQSTLEAGTILLFDYRLLHQGTANSSNTIRALPFSVYSSPWFKDHANRPDVSIFRHH